MAIKIESYKGEKIERDEEGFFWRKGGYFDTVAECRADIDYDIAEDEAFYEPLTFREDTPSLSPAWWTER